MAGQQAAECSGKSCSSRIKQTWSQILTLFLFDPEQITSSFYTTISSAISFEQYCQIIFRIRNNIMKVLSTAPGIGMTSIDNSCYASQNDVIKCPSPASSWISLWWECFRCCSPVGSNLLLHVVHNPLSFSSASSSFSLVLPFVATQNKSKPSPTNSTPDMWRQSWYPSLISSVANLVSSLNPSIGHLVLISPRTLLSPFPQYVSMHGKMLASHKEQWR